MPFIFDLVILTSPEVLSKVHRKHFLSSSMYLLVLLQHFYSLWQTGIDVRVGTEAEAQPATSPYCISLFQSSSWNRVVELCFERDGSSISPVHQVIWALHLWSVYTGPSTVQTGSVQLRTRGLEETGPCQPWASASWLKRSRSKVWFCITGFNIPKHLFWNLGPTFLLSLFSLFLSVIQRARRHSSSWN